MTARTGAEYKEGIKDDREVWVGKEQVNIFEHPTMKGAIEGMAGYFDYQNKFADDCLVIDEVSGKPMSASHIVPKNAEDLQKRHRCFDRLARYSYGMLGRTPDYVNVSLAGQVARSDIYHDAGAGKFYDNLVKFQREVIEKDLSLTHTILNAAVDRSTGELAGLNSDLTLRVVKRDENGITVRGAKLLATLGPYADENFVYPAAPCPPGYEDYALSFSVPCNAKGVIQICRDDYGVVGDRADFPFSSRFDEQDTVFIFDDVEIPWERVFCDGNLDVYNKIPQAVFYGNVLQQTSVRAGVKLEFAYDLCHEMAKMTNSQNYQPNQQMLGEIWSYMVLTKATLDSCEKRAYDWGAGAFFPHADLGAIRQNMPVWMARVNDIIKTMGAHYLLATPSVDLFDHPRIGKMLETYLPGACGIDGRERAQIFRTAWDFAGSALGGRVELYERFYLASRQRNTAMDHMFAQSRGGWGQVHEFLNESGVLPKKD